MNISTRNCSPSDNWQKKLENVGIYCLSDKKPTEDEIKSFENQFSCSLPKDYRDFLKDYGESDLTESVVYPIKSSNLYIGTFIGIGYVRDFDEYSFYEERLPTNCIPINVDDADNLIIMSLDKDSFGMIYFQHHCMGVGDEDTNEKRWKTMTFLAKNFSSFIENIEFDE